MHRPEFVVGLMSGTSLDGVDAALVRFNGLMHAELIAHVTRPYQPEERAQILSVLEHADLRAMALLHVRLAQWAADAVEAVLAKAQVPATQLDLIAFPGQTLWHEPPTVTWQLGEPAVLAERFGVQVVHNFRARDVAAGGQGAPLVTAADVLLFGDTEGPRALINIGGMANVSFVPKRGEDHGAFAFDTGPGVAILDALAAMAERGRTYDRDGAIAKRGTIRDDVVAALLADPWFSEAPPKSTGRERFGVPYARALQARLPGPDGVATAAALSGRSIAEAIHRFLPAQVPLVGSGGGMHHPVLVRELESHLSTLRRTPTRVQPFSELFFDGDAKEAVAFALLGLLTIRGQPGNLPSVTGARGARVLGAVTPA